MRKRIFKFTSLFLAILFVLHAFSTSAEAATRVYWYKKMTAGGTIFYWVDSGVEYSTSIRNAEVEIEIPAAGYYNPMKMSKTTTKSSSKMDFYQYSDTASSTIAITYSYRANHSTPMPVSDKDVYDWYWCKIELNHSQLRRYSLPKIVAIVVHEMLHAYGRKDTYSADQKSSIMYGYSNGTARGVTADANSFLNSKY